MDLTLQPLALQCCVSGREFLAGDRVVCYLVRESDGLSGRRDLLESEDGRLLRPPEVFCRWVISYKPRRVEDNADRMLKLTAENLFLTLADPANPSDDANTPLLQFLALMLERKKLLKPRGLTTDGSRQLLEHMRTRRLFEVPVGTLDAAFFVRIQGQLDILMGGSRRAPEASDAAPAGATAGPASA